MAEQQLVFSGDASSVANALNRLIAQNQALEKSFSAAAQGAERATKLATAALKEQGATVQRLVQQNEHLRQKLDSLKQSQGTFVQGQAAAGRALTQTAGNVTRLNAGLGQLGFAVDDFVTVWGMQGGAMGFVGGIRAASNNISVLLAGMHPLLAIVPALGGVIAGSLVTSLSNTTTESAKATDALKGVHEVMARIREETEKANLGAKEFAKIKAAQPAEEELRKLREVARQAEEGKVTVTPDKVIVSEPGVQQLLEEEKKARRGVELAEGFPAGGDREDARRLARQRLEDVRRRLAEKRQQANAAKAEIARIEAAEKERAAAVQSRERAEAAIRPFEPKLRSAAAAAFREGRPAADVRSELAKIVDLAMPGAAEDVRRGAIEDILAEAKSEEAARAAQTPLERRSEDLDFRMQQLRVGEGAAKAMSPRGRLPRRQERAFQRAREAAAQEEAALRLEEARRARGESGISGATEQFKAIADGINETNKLLRDQNKMLQQDRQQGRPVQRNAGL